jgi:parallel beta-helix repeat protein
MGRKRSVAVGTGLSLGAAMGMASGAQADDYVVDNNSNDNSAPMQACTAAANDCSLIGAISKANGTAAFDRVTFASTVTGQITLNGQLNVIHDLSVYGPGANKLTINGNDAGRIFASSVGSTDDLAVGFLTLANGRINSDGGAILVNSGGLTVLHSVISGSDALSGNDGGAIQNFGTGDVSIYNSTLSGNSAGRNGGAIYSYSSGDVTVAQSTVSGNSAGNQGGGLWVKDTSLVNFSAVAGNSAATGGGIFQSSGGAAFLFSSILADNTAPAAPDFSGAGLAQISLVENPGSMSTPAGTMDIVGRDPQLGPLQNNGGSMSTMRPAATSPVIDQGAGDTPGDQRGKPRLADIARVPNALPDDGFYTPGVDIGPVELTEAEAALPPVATKCKKKKGKKGAATSAKKKKKKCKKKKKKK